MTEDEGRRWIAEHFGQSRCERLARFLEMVVDENERQNLIARSTLDRVWVRHAVDSAQLLLLTSVTADTQWLDIGTGAGFPGMVAALLSPAVVTMVEPRRRRAEFLMFCCASLHIENARVSSRRVEQVTITADIISARAVASIDDLIRLAGNCATGTTQWLLPRGQVDPESLWRLGSETGITFHVEHSITDPDAAIVVGKGRPR